MGETTYSTLDIRARAVHAVVEERLPVRVVSQAYGTDRSTIHRWVSRYRNNGDSGLLRRPVSGRPRKVKHLDSDRLKHQELKGHQAKTKNELKLLTHKKLTDMSHDRELLQGIFFRCCVADFLK